jgi:hypothetical protein
MRPDSPEKRVLLAIGARFSLRGSARQVLKTLQGLTDSERHRTGWTQPELIALEKLAVMEIESFPYGDWPRPAG